MIHCPDWIAVSERLPDRYALVNIFVGKKVASGFINTRGDWQVYGPMATLDAAVTHWMPLPSPPASVPYPEFCRHPSRCAGLSVCPRDPCCAD